MDFGQGMVFAPHYFMLMGSPGMFYQMVPMTVATPAPTYAEMEQLPKNQNQPEIILTRNDLLAQGYQPVKKAWTEDQDKLLMKICKESSAKFDEIAKLIPGRNAKMCYSRFRRLSYKAKESWSKSEDAKLFALAKEFDQNWKEIAMHFSNRNHKQLKDHYLNYLRPELSKESWTVEEDELLISMINAYGKNWKLIEQRMPNRSRNQIKNRFFGRILRLNKRKLLPQNETPAQIEYSRQ